MSAVQPDPRKPFVLLSPNGVVRDATDAVLEVSRNYTMDAGAQITVRLYDNNREMLRAMYFRIGQEFLFGDELFVVNAINVQQGEGNGAEISLEMLDYSFFQLKNDFSPQNYRAGNGFLYAQIVAKKYGLDFIGENVKGKQQTVKVKAKNNTESVWSVLQSAASSNQYLCFIAGGTLYFASPRYLIGRWGTKSIKYKPVGETKERTFSFVPIVYPTPTDAEDFFLVGMPSLRKSNDSIKNAEGSASIFGPSARNLRAGMTIMIYGMSETFNKEYLVTSVDFQDNSVEPTEINFANVASLAPEDKKKVDQKISEITVISGSGGSS